MASAPTALNPQTSFESETGEALLSFEGEEPLTSQELPEERRHFRVVSRLVLEINHPTDSEPLAIPIQREKACSLVHEWIPYINRALRAIRYFGTVPHVSEIRVPDSSEECERLLREWAVEGQLQDAWQPLVAPLKLGGFLALLSGREFAQPVPELFMGSWVDVEEAIQDDLAPQPEREFLTNSIENIRLQNFRLALLEAVICLEIVIAQFLKTYLLNAKRLNKQRIKNTLNPR